LVFFLRKQQLLAAYVFHPLGLHFVDHKNYTHCNGCLQTLRKLKIPPEDIFFECKFKGQVTKCDSIFEEIHLENGGICYTFNGLGLYRKKNVSHVVKKWTINEGYAPTASLDAYPYRATGVGTKYGLSLVLRYKKSALELILEARFGFSV
jgi:Amiloride-sensitive sodium channel